MIDIKSKREIELMREACKVTAQVHKAIAEAIKPGISTLELDKIAEKVIRENRWYSCTKGLSKLSKGCSRFSEHNMCIYK